MKYTLRTDAEKRRLLAEFRTSGLTRTQFAKARGLSWNSLRDWEARPELNGGQAMTRFVEVEVVEARVPAPMMVHVGGAGHRIEVPRGFDIGDLRRLVAALC